MRVALCLSGQPRFVKETAPLIIENVCNGYHVDVFAHLWFDEKMTEEPYKMGKGWSDKRIERNVIETFNSIYKPILLKTESTKIFLNSSLNFEKTLNRHYRYSIDDPFYNDFRNKTLSNTFSYFYSLNEVNKMKKVYEHENDFKYDWVVRCRTDAEVRTKIHFGRYNPNYLHFSNRQNQPDGMINDWFDFGNSFNMDVFMGVYPFSELMINKCIEDHEGVWCPELMHRKMIDIFGIKIQGHPIDVTLQRY